MARFDRKRWWESKPTPPKPKYYGIVRDVWVTGGFLPDNRGFIDSPVVKVVYKVEPYYKHLPFHIDQKLTKAEAEALCAILNAEQN